MSQTINDKNQKAKPNDNSSNENYQDINDIPSVESQEIKKNDKNIKDIDDINEDESQEVKNKEERKSPETSQEEQKEKEKDDFFAQTILSTVIQKSDIQPNLPENNRPIQFPSQKDTVEVKLSNPLPMNPSPEKGDSQKPVEVILKNPIPLNPLQEGENPPINNLPQDVIHNLNPNIKTDKNNIPRYPLAQKPELQGPNEHKPKNKKINNNPPFKPPYPYPNSQYPNSQYPNIQYPNAQNYPPNQQEMNPAYDEESPIINAYPPYLNQRPLRQNPKRKAPKKKSPKRKSPNYKPKGPFNPQSTYTAPPEKIFRNPNPLAQEPKMRRPQSTKGPIVNPTIPYSTQYEYPRRYRNPDIPGRSLSRSKSRSFSKEKRKSPSPAYIPFAYPTSGRCFACDVQCSISRSGNSPSKYVPYLASFKKLRKNITYYDGEKYGYYQYASRLPENDQINNINYLNNF